MKVQKQLFAAVSEMSILPSVIDGRKMSHNGAQSLLPEYFFSDIGPANITKMVHKILDNPQTVEVFQGELIKCCLTHLSDSYLIHLNRLKGLEILNHMAVSIPVAQLDETTVTHMIWATLSCIHHFLIILKMKKSLKQWMIKKQVYKAFATYSNLLFYLLPSYYNVVFYAIVVFFEEAGLWEIEYLSSNLLKRLFILIDETNRTNSIFEMLFLIENSTLSNFNLSRQTLRITYSILDVKQWIWVNDKLLQTFLDMYYKSLTPEANHEFNYEYLEKGLELCIRGMSKYFEKEKLLSMIIWMLKLICAEKISDENLLIFGGLLEHITNAYCRSKNHCIFPHKVPRLILTIIDSKNLLYSLLGHRILQHLTDKNNNRQTFDTPKIFLKNSKYKINITTCDEVDKFMFRQYRHKFHNTFFDGIQAHGTQSSYLEIAYTSMCLFVVTVPCSYTAAAGVNFAMAIQEYALKTKNIQTVLAHQLHATVGSLLSLICYIHTATVFHEYVERIIEIRAINAPHLNPPVKKRYNYAQHHILWNKMELFFEDWRARYGLWRCFRNKKKDVYFTKNRKESDSSDKQKRARRFSLTQK